MVSNRRDSSKSITASTPSVVLLEGGLSQDSEDNHYFEMPQSMEDRKRRLSRSDSLIAATETSSDSSDAGSLNEDDIEASLRKPLIIDNNNKIIEDSGRPPWHAFLLLTGAVMALSSVGPSMDLQRGVSAPLKLVWRMSGTSALLLPFVARSCYLEGSIPKLTTKQWLTFGLALLGYCTMTLGFVKALDYTSVGNAVIFSNSQALILLAGRALVGSPVVFLEGFGALVAFGGAMMCATDPTQATSVDVEAESSWGIWGDVMAIISAFGGVTYLTFGKEVRPLFGSVINFMFYLMAGSTVVNVIFMMLTGEEISLSRHPDHGVLGWTQSARADRLPLETYMIVVCSLLGSMGYVRSMQYFDNVVIAVATLMEPVVASFLAFTLGVGLLPGIQGWLGNALVAVGTFTVVYPTMGDKPKAH